MCEAAGMRVSVGEHVGHVGVDHAGPDAWGWPQVASGRPSECRVHMEGAVCCKTRRGGRGAGLPRGAKCPCGWEARVGSAAHRHARVGRCNQWARGCVAQYALVAWACGRKLWGAGVYMWCG